MPIQTTKKDYIYLPDGCQVLVKESGGVYFDVGAINSAVEATLEYDINEIETANAGKLNKQSRNFRCTGGFTLINLDPEGIENLSGGLFERVVTAGATVAGAGITNQVISAGWDDGVVYPLSLIETGVEAFRPDDTPAFTSITLDLGGTPEVLALNTNYIIVKDSSASSGYGIQFLSGGMVTVTPKTFAITINYADNDPIASQVVYAGQSTHEFVPYSLKFEHTDDNGKVRSLELFSVTTESGGFTFGFKGANEDGVDEMPITFAAEVDGSLVNKRQLMAWSVDER